MDKILKEKAEQTEEGRLKIQEIKKIEKSRTINIILKVLGAIICGSTALGSLIIGVQAQLGKFGEKSNLVVFTCVVMLLTSGGIYGIISGDRNWRIKNCKKEIARIEEEIKKL